MKAENRIDQRMPPEPDHRLLSPFQKKRRIMNSSSKPVGYAILKLAGDNQDKRRRSDQALVITPAPGWKGCQADILSYQRHAQRAFVLFYL
jgi:hypothetical protein